MRIIVNAHSRDMSSLEIRDDDQNTIFEHDGYFPKIDNLGYDDDLGFEIDNETGKIIGWIPLTAEDIRVLKDEYDKHDDDDDDVVEDEDMRNWKPERYEILWTEKN